MAEARQPGYDRQGAEVPAFGLRVVMILRWGAERSNDVLDPRFVSRWIQEATDGLATLEAFRRALAAHDAPQHEGAVCLRERLQLGAPLLERGLLSADLTTWYETALGA
jgi:hypothetical protein